MKVAQSCPTLCDLMNYTVHAILQARILEWGSRSLLQGVFPTQGSNPGVLHCRPILYQLSHKGSPDIQICPTLSCGLVPLMAVIHWAYLSLGMIPASSVAVSPLSITLLRSHAAFSPVCPGGQGWWSTRARANRIIADCAFL